ncbi:hypothetical protein OsJ_07905 [Oryza sativa Japonica Group]|uniref:Uncharacterized protein n=1 Tax=Oryza sativa subsp. japonica TaxID=39947 RepID=Q6EPG1_ORYSJ|nr:hypothetical protein OsJ_07905 [Oryza sativa Japonica Group]BAD29459.1 hypothetical protein [Oryza sativa Japonica Group]
MAVPKSKQSRERIEITVSHQRKSKRQDQGTGRLNKKDRPRNTHINKIQKKSRSQNRPGRAPADTASVSYRYLLIPDKHRPSFIDGGGHYLLRWRQPLQPLSSLGDDGDDGLPTTTTTLPLSYPPSAQSFHPLDAMAEVSLILLVIVTVASVILALPRQEEE